MVKRFALFFAVTIALIQGSEPTAELAPVEFDVIDGGEVSFNIQDRVKGDVGEATGKYYLKSGDKGLAVEFDLEYYFDFEYEFGKAVSTASALADSLNSLEERTEEHSSQLRMYAGIELESTLSDFADSVASRHSGMKVRWISLKPKYDEGLFLFEYGDPFLGNATALQEDQKFFLAGSQFEKYARKIEDPYWLAVAGENFLYAAEFDKQAQADQKALALFEEAFSGKQGLDHLFRVQYSVVLVRLGRKSLEELKNEDVGPLPVFWDSPRRDLFRKYLSWYP